MTVSSINFGSDCYLQNADMKYKASVVSSPKDIRRNRRKSNRLEVLAEDYRIVLIAASITSYVSQGRQIRTKWDTGVEGEQGRAMDSVDDSHAIGDRARERIAEARATPKST
jgi:hypothetical protein